MAIRITSRKGGFRRCKVEHPATPTVYPDDRFTPQELAALKAEPMLIVEEITDGPAGGGDPLEAMTKAELKEYAKANNLDIPASAKTNPDIIAAIKAAEAAKVAGAGQGDDAGTGA